MISQPEMKSIYCNIEILNPFWAIVKLMENIGWQADDRFEPASTDIQNSKSLNLGQKLQASKIGQNYQFRK